MHGVNLRYLLTLLAVGIEEPENSYSNTTKTTLIRFLSFFFSFGLFFFLLFFLFFYMFYFSFFISFFYWKRKTRLTDKKCTLACRQTHGDKYWIFPCKKKIILDSNKTHHIQVITRIKMHPSCKFNFSKTLVEITRVAISDRPKFNWNQSIETLNRFSNNIRNASAAIFVSCTESQRIHVLPLKNKEGLAFSQRSPNKSSIRFKK